MVGSVIVDVDAYQVLAMKRCLRIYGYRDISFFELFYFAFGCHDFKFHLKDVAVAFHHFNDKFYLSGRSCLRCKGIHGSLIQRYFAGVALKRKSRLCLLGNLLNGLFRKGNFNGCSGFCRASCSRTYNNFFGLVFEGFLKNLVRGLVIDLRSRGLAAIRFCRDIRLDFCRR